MIESPIKLEWSDICHHEPRCQSVRWLYHTVPSYSVYFKARRWLGDRGYKFICSEGEKIEFGDSWHYSGRYIFKFLCEQEYILFVLRWES
jgi:hypothetical protein